MQWCLHPKIYGFPNPWNRHVECVVMHKVSIIYSILRPSIILETFYFIKMTKEVVTCNFSIFFLEKCPEIVRYPLTIVTLISEKFASLCNSLHICFLNR